MVKCQDVRENLSAYLDGELSKKETSDIAGHLLVCHHCRAHWEELQTTSALLRDMPEVVPPPEFITGLRERLASMPAPRADNGDNNGFYGKLRKVAKAPWYKVAAAAAVFGMAVGITSLWNGGNVDLINSPDITKNGYEVQRNHLHVPGSNGLKQGDIPVVNDLTIGGEQGTEVDPGNNSGVLTPGAGSVEPTAPVEPTAVVNNTNPTGRWESHLPSSSSVIDSQNVDLSRLVVVSSTMKLGVNDTNAAAKRVESIAIKYKGTANVNGNVATIRIPWENYSPVLAELGSMGEMTADVPSQNNITADYRVVAKELEQKQLIEAELIKQLGEEPGNGQAEQALSAVRSDITALQGKMQSMINDARNIKIRIELIEAN